MQRVQKIFHSFDVPVNVFAMQLYEAVRVSVIETKSRIVNVIKDMLKE